MHPRSGGFQATAWEGTLLYAVGVELAHQWGVPALAGVFGTDAPMPGWQSAADPASSLLLLSLCGAETGAGLGLLESCTLWYPEAMLLDADIYQRVRHEAAGLDTSPQELALDLIREVGPRSHFMAHPHTRTNLRKRAFSRLSGQAAKTGGLLDPLEVARGRAEQILREHHPQPLEDRQSAELRRILNTARQEFV
jgi:trimethylamine--corrinoid protein Co-methyltransferase